VKFEIVGSKKVGNQMLEPYCGDNLCYFERA